ncbi:hypothetical protein ACIBTV_27135 [Micromonospora sp. NPDC049366]|uniref:hypothetical protein n=1 Tax=Micromonospora sp. NPDC049366 TaxID=3364271 RepID=UPI003793A056
MTTPTPPASTSANDPDGDVVARIDAAVSNARDDVCACGCGVTLTSDAASLYFATEACQRSFALQQNAQAAGDHELAENLRAQRRGTPPPRVVSFDDVLFPRRERVARWLRANGIPALNVAAGDPIVTTPTTVTVFEYIRNEDGAILVLPGRDAQTTARTYPLVEPWPDGLEWEHHYHEEQPPGGEPPSAADVPDSEPSMTVDEAVALMAVDEPVDAVALPDEHPLAYRVLCSRCRRRGAPYGYGIHAIGVAEPVREILVCEHCGAHSGGRPFTATVRRSQRRQGLSLTLSVLDETVNWVIPDGRLTAYRDLRGVWDQMHHQLSEQVENPRRPWSDPQSNPLADVREVAAQAYAVGQRGPVSVAPVGTPLGGPGWVDVGYVDADGDGVTFGFDGATADEHRLALNGYHTARWVSAIDVGRQGTHAEWLARWRRLNDAFFHRMHVHFAIVGEQAKQLSKQMERLFAAARPEPNDPMLRAIEAKKHRNTGPQHRQRAPKRIDPRRGRR